MSLIEKVMILGSLGAASLGGAYYLVAYKMGLSKENKG